jgi:hypothetical protein
VTSDSVQDGDPSWSPSGSTLVEGRTRSAGDTEDIATVASAGGSPSVLVDGSSGAEAGEPQFSPNGTKIAFQQRNGPSEDIYVMDANGTNIVDVTPANDGDSKYPAWSPDGSHLAFASNRTGVFELFVVDVSGGPSDGQLFPITAESTVNDIQPVWSPDQTALAYTRGCADDGCQGSSGFENGDIYKVDVSDLAHPGTPVAVVATSNPEFEPDWGVACTTSCGPISVTRSASLRLKGHLKAVGLLATVSGQHVKCADGRKVQVQRKKGTTWKTIRTATTDASGHYAAALPNVSGTYRALAPRTDLSRTDNLVCQSATSKTRAYSAHHARTIPSFNLGAFATGMFANGQLKALDHFDPCTTHQPVQIQKQSGSTWKTIATARGQSSGTNGLANFGKNIPKRNGLYRAHAPRTMLTAGDVCAAATSKSVRFPIG